MEYKACKVVVNPDIEEQIPLIPIQNKIDNFENIFCETIKDSIKFLNSQSFSDRLRNSNHVFPVKFQIANNLIDLSEDDLKELSGNFKNDSIVIYLTSILSLKFSIHWKSKDIDNLISLKPFTDILSKDDEEIYEEAVEMIANSLNNNQLGESTILNF